MYGIFTYIYHQKGPNVGIYTIHGWYGYKVICFLILSPTPFLSNQPHPHLGSSEAGSAWAKQKIFVSELFKQ